MSYAGTVLDHYCSASRGRLKALCDETGLHNSTMSQVRSGDRDCTLHMISRIVPIVDRATATDLLIAWLRDQTPDCGRHLVCIARAPDTHSDTIHINELARAWELLRDEAERNPALQKIILNLAALTERIRGNISVSEPTAMVAETPDDAYNADKPDPQQK